MFESHQMKEYKSLGLAIIILLLYYLLISTIYDFLGNNTFIIIFVIVIIYAEILDLNLSLAMTAIHGVLSLLYHYSIASIYPEDLL